MSRTPRTDLAWYERELGRAEEWKRHQDSVIGRWFTREYHEVTEKTKRIYESELDRVQAEYDSRVRWLESEIERLKTLLT